MPAFRISLLAKAAALLGAGFVALTVLAAPASAESLGLDGVPTSVTTSGHGWIG